MPDIFQYEFMTRALIGGALVGALAPALGVFLFLRRLSLIADTLAHVAFMGVAIGILTRTFPPLAALGVTSAAAASIEYLRSRRLMPGDAALAIFLYASLAVAVVIISIAEGFNSDVFGYLFGTVLTTSTSDLWLVGIVAVVAVGFVVMFFSELAQTSLDLDLARTSGVHVNLVNLLLAVLTGATITLSMRIVGVLLVGALTIIPVVASLRIATGLRQTVFVAVFLGVLSAVAGLTIAFYANVAPGGAVVLTSIGILFLAVLWGRARDALSKPAAAQGSAGSAPDP